MFGRAPGLLSRSRLVVGALCPDAVRATLDENGTVWGERSLFVGGAEAEERLVELRAGPWFDSPYVSPSGEVPAMLAISSLMCVNEPGSVGSVLKLIVADHVRRAYELTVHLLGPEACSSPHRTGEGSPWTRGPLVGFLRSRAATIEGETSEVTRNVWAIASSACRENPMRDTAMLDGTFREADVDC